jgi:hypothetical protein
MEWIFSAGIERVFLALKEVMKSQNELAFGEYGIADVQ